MSSSNVLDIFKSLYKSKLFDIFLKYYFVIIITCLVFYIIYYFISNKKLNETFINQLTKRNGKSNENNSETNNKNSNKTNEVEIKDKIFNLFWTGGYDSTYRLCEMLLIENKIVQPYYISFDLDNDKQLIEKYKNKMNSNIMNSNKNKYSSNNKDSSNIETYIDNINPNKEITVFFRNNRKQERKAMENVVKYINEYYPEKAYRLLPVIEITEDIQDDEFNKTYDELFFSANLFPKKRKIHQYYYLFKFAYYYKIQIDIGVLGIHRNKLFAKFLNKYLKPYNEEYYIKSLSNSKSNSNKNTNNIISDVNQINNNKNKIVKKIVKNYRIPFNDHYMYYISYPLHNRSKKDLLDKAKANGFDKILYLSWSCWFPNPKTGKECGKCPMCKERII
jgi:hypothetical protein